MCIREIDQKAHSHLDTFDIPAKLGLALSTVFLATSIFAIVIYKVQPQWSAHILQRISSKAFFNTSASSLAISATILAASTTLVCLIKSNIEKRKDLENKALKEKQALEQKWEKEEEIFKELKSKIDQLNLNEGNLSEKVITLFSLLQQQVKVKSQAKFACVKNIPNNRWVGFQKLRNGPFAINFEVNISFNNTTCLTELLSTSQDLIWSFDEYSGTKTTTKFIENIHNLNQYEPWSGSSEKYKITITKYDWDKLVFIVNSDHPEVLAQWIQRYCTILSKNK